MQIPLMQWTLLGDDLPERYFDGPKKEAFTLPGAQALSEFADLIGGDEQQERAPVEQGVPYTLGALFEEDLGGEIALTREIDFGSLCGDRALLMFSHLCGSGEVYLGETCVARFGKEAQYRQAFDMTGMPCVLCVDVSEALRLGRREILRLRFDASRPAGVAGCVFLGVTSRAHLSRVSVQPDAIRRTMTVRARISAQHAGRYVLRVQPIAGEAGKALPPARETDYTLDAGEERSIQLALSVDAPVFVPGQAYDAPALNIQLFVREEKNRTDGCLCDEALLLCGYPGAAPRSYLPLLQEDCLGEPKLLCEKIHDLGVSAVLLPGYVPDGLYPALTRAGIAAVQHVSEEIRPMFTRYPCLTLLDAPTQEEELSLEASAWQMAGSVAFPRAIDHTMTEEEMLLEASGRLIDSASPGVKDALKWLRAVQIRMRAEAARQGRYQGALCSAQDIRCSDVVDALHTAFSPAHMSALPLSGAWWTGTRFSASLEACFPRSLLEQGPVHACAVLEDDDGAELARVYAPCAKSGYVGVIEAQLPDMPCVLTLHCALLCGEKVIEENMLPVYVGERGPLEAAF